MTRHGMEWNRMDIGWLELRETGTGPRRTDCMLFNLGGLIACCVDQIRTELTILVLSKNRRDLSVGLSAGCLDVQPSALMTYYK